MAAAQRVDVPPVRAVGGEEQRALRRPARRDDRFAALAARHAPHVAEIPMRIDRGDVEVRRVPRHIGMIPSNPCQLRSVGRKLGGENEVGAARNNATRVRARVNPARQ